MVAVRMREQSNSNSTVSRRKYLATAGMAVTVGLTGCSGGSGGGDSGGSDGGSGGNGDGGSGGTVTDSSGPELVPINVGLVGGSYGEAQAAAYIDTWNEEHDVEITNVSRPGVGEIIAEMQAAGDPSSMGWSVAHSNSVANYQGAINDLWAPLQPDDFQNFDNLERLVPTEASYEPNPDEAFHHLPMNYGANGLAWNTELMDEPAGWGDLLRDDLQGKISLPVWVNDAVARNAIAQGMEINNINENYEEKVSQIFDRVSRENNYVATWFSSGAEMEELVTNETAWTGVLWYGRVLNRQSEGVPLDYKLPEEGTDAWVDTWQVPAGLDEDRLYTAKRFLDWTMRPENVQILTENIAYGTAVEVPDPPESYNQNPDIEAFDEGLIDVWDPSIIEEHQDDWQIRFEEATN